MEPAKNSPSGSLDERVTLNVAQLNILILHQRDLVLNTKLRPKILLIFFLLTKCLVLNKTL